MAFNQGTDLELGEGLLLYVEDMVAETPTLIPVAYATTHTVSVNGDTIDTSSKMSGAWQDFLVGQLNWQVTSESLVSKTSGHMSFNTLLALMVKREPINIKIGTPTDDTDFTLDATKPTLSGSAVITSLEKTATKGEVCTSSLNLQGKGELKSLSA